MLVNNAGVGAVTPLLLSDIDKMAEMISLDVLTLTRSVASCTSGQPPVCAADEAWNVRRL